MTGAGPAPWIFVDWGSTNFRAFLWSEGHVAGRMEAAGHGILTSWGEENQAARAPAFGAFLGETLRDWLERHPGCPLLLCGAIGSREGWVQTGYVEAPAGFAEVAKGARVVQELPAGPLTGHTVSIVAGLAQATPDGRHDVMRSEEVKALGAAAHLGHRDAVLCIPGTHCKWIRIEGGRIVALQTVLTGDLFGALCGGHTLAPLLGTAAQAGAATHDASFDRGLELARQGADLLRDLWQVRAVVLHGTDAPADLRAFLSGILIGHEMRERRAVWPEAGRVLLVCDAGERREFYRRAAAAFGLVVAETIDSETAVCAGLARVAARLAAGGIEHGAAG